MKSKLFSKAPLLLTAAILLFVSLLTGFAESSSTFGCPEGTGGYASKGIRTKKTCENSVSERGYWWYIGGDVKWVGTITAGVGGRFEAAMRTTTYVGQEYNCVGIDNVCWVCNCYYIGVSAADKE